MPNDVTLGRYHGVTDEWLRTWRITVLNKGSAAASVTGFISGMFSIGAAVGGSTVPAEQLADGTIAGAVTFSSEVPTGQSPGLETYAAGLRIHFTVTQSTNHTPNTAEITIYNLRDDTANNLIQEYNYVILQAGYEWGATGTIFTGTIKYYKKGHEGSDPTTSYLKIYAADGDKAINGATINENFKEFVKESDKIDALMKTLEEHGVTEGYVEPGAIQQWNATRPEVMSGMTADNLRDIAQRNNAIWYVLDQKFYWAKPTSYDAGTIVQLTAATGLIGFPEVTQDGLNITALINPKIRLRQRIHLDNQYINQYYEPGAIPGVSTGAAVSFSSLSEIVYEYPIQNDGYYVPLVINYEGDSKSGPWFMYCICLAVDASKDPILSMLGAFDWSFLS